MDVVVYTHHARYEGTVQPGPGHPRLQDMLNNPVMFSVGSTLATNQILLHEVTITTWPDKEPLRETRPLIMIYPKAVEMVFETSHSFQGAPSAVYEKLKPELEKTRVEILTTGLKRVQGEVLHGLRSLTHLQMERMFFAMTQVELQTLVPEPMTIEIDYVLMNYNHVESFAPVPPA